MMGLPARLWRISPFGPIFGKELRTTARRKRTYWLRFFYLAALFLVLLLAYTSTVFQSSGYVSVAERAQQEAELGYTFFTAISMFSVFALAAVSPVLTATAVSAERQHRTLDVLLMTPITSWQIIGGKLFSRMLAALTLIGLSLPVLAVVRLLGGFEVQTMLGVLATCVAFSLAMAALGLFFSTFMNRAYAVILLSYAAMLLVYLFVPFILVLTFAPRGPRVGLANFLAAINPFAAIGFVASGARILRGVSFWPCIVVHLAMAAGLVVWSSAIVRRRARREGGPAAAPPMAAADAMNSEAPPANPQTIAPLGDAEAQPDQADAAAAAAPPLAHERQRGVYDNPVLWREIRQPLMKRRWQARLGALVCLSLLLVTYVCIAAAGGGSAYRTPLGEPDPQMGFAVVLCGLMCLLICVLSATTIAGEKESDTWTLLLVTPTSGRAVVIGKVLGILRRLLWPSVLVAGHFVLFTICGVLPVSALVLVLWIIVTFNSIWIASGLYFSLRVQKVTFAVILNLVAPVVTYGLVLLVLAILGNLFEGNGPRRIHQFALLYNPYAYLVSGLEGLTRGFTYQVYGYGAPDAAHRFWAPTFPERLTAGEFFRVVFTVGVLYLAAAGLILWHTIHHFDRIVGRARQRQGLPPRMAGLAPVQATGA